MLRSLVCLIVLAALSFAAARAAVPAPHSLLQETPGGEARVQEPKAEADAEEGYTHSLRLLFEEAELPEPRRTCVSCDGKQYVKALCVHCEGDGRGPCVGCVHIPSFDWIQREIELLEVVSPAEAGSAKAKLRELVGQTARKLEKAKNLQSPNELARRALAAPGKIRCPANCNPRAEVKGLVKPCLMCSKTQFLKCQICRGRGEATCYACEGKKKREVLCPECIGSGRSFDVHDADRKISDCPWCLGRQVRECGYCAGAERIEYDCADCLGSGERACRNCLGTRRDMCDSCRGHGVTFGFTGSGTPCTTCRRQGFTQCQSCKKGTTRCFTCSGKGIQRGKCPHCNGFRFVFCGGCERKSPRAWIATAERLQGAGKQKDALAYFDMALTRLGPHQELEREELVGTDSDRKVQERAHASERKGLQKLRSKAAK